MGPISNVVILFVLIPILVFTFGTSRAIIGYSDIQHSCRTDSLKVQKITNYGIIILEKLDSIKKGLKWTAYALKALSFVPIPPLAALARVGKLICDRSKEIISSSQRTIYYLLRAFLRMTPAVLVASLVRHEAIGFPNVPGLQVNKKGREPDTTYERRTPFHQKQKITMSWKRLLQLPPWAATSTGFKGIPISGECQATIIQEDQKWIAVLGEGKS